RPWLPVAALLAITIAAGFSAYRTRFPERDNDDTMTNDRDRLKLRDFTPLDDETEMVQRLGELKCRFAINDEGSVVKLYAWHNLTDEHTQLILALPNLKSFSSTNLRPSSTGLSDAGLAALLSNPNLEEIECHGNQKVTGTFLRDMDRNSSLTRIGLPHCFIDDAGLALARDSSLTHISLRGSLISDASIDALCSMRHLKQVHVKETRVTSLGPDQLRKALPNCWIDRLDRPNDG
ncbi:hypothetical protein, partial [Rhodopirellula bahusiensis]